MPPPVGTQASDQKLWLRLGQFIIAVVLGLVFLASRRWRQPRHAIWWSCTALFCLVLGVAVFFRYQQLTLAWTASYAGQKVVVGSALTPAGQAYVQVNPGISVEDLVLDFAGRTDAIWTADSINRRRLVLAGIYAGCLPLFTICLIAVVQAVGCGTQGPREPSHHSRVPEPAHRVKPAGR